MIPPDPPPSPTSPPSEVVTCLLASASFALFLFVYFGFLWGAVIEPTLRDEFNRTLFAPHHEGRTAIPEEQRP